MHRTLGQKPAIYKTSEELKRNILRDIFVFSHYQFGRESESASHVLNAPALEFIRTEIDRTRGAIATFSTQLTAWPKEIKSVGWLDRAEFRSIQGRIEDSDHSSTLLIGPPGSGKSALLSKVAEWGLEKGFAVLGIKSDMLPKEVASIDDLSRLILGGDLGLIGKLRELSVSSPVLVLIDQLDALGSLSDLETGRLNAVLDFVQQLVRSRSVHLVVSVRSFELKADQRLLSITEHASVIELAILEEKQVHDTLGANSIDSTNWPQTYIEFLRTPYHLSLFLQTFDSQNIETKEIPEALLFSSIQAIHDKRWDQLISGRTEASSKAISDVLFALGDKISTSEILWHPRTDFGSLSDELLGELEELGWLTRTGDLLGFAHQTQYEFILAKRFCGAPDSFFGYVWTRRDRLTVRPVVWHVLNYLRDRDFVGYVQVMGRFLAQIERRHLERLLLEFLAEVPNPTTQEVSWLRSYLESDKHYATTCWLLREKMTWFESLPDDCIINLMKWELHKAWPVSRLLEKAIRFAHDRTKKLIRTTWAYKSDYANQVAHVLHEAEKFDDETVAWAHASCVDATVSTWASQRLIDRLSEVSPPHAPRILAAKLEQFYFGAVQTKPEPAPKPEDFAKEEDYAVETVVHSREIDDRLESLLECDGLFKIGDLAQKVPKEFFRCIWPWFKKVVTSCSANRVGCYNQYRVESGMQQWLGRQRHREYSILSALETAIQSFATLSPHEFVQTVVEEQHLNSMTCQRLLAQGLVSIAHRVPEFILEYFLCDQRRLFVGADRESTLSVRLLMAVVNYWNREQQSRFESYVLSSSIYSDFEPDEWHERTVNRIRGKFLTLLPKLHRSTETIKLIEKVLLESPDAYAPRERTSDIEMTRVVSPVEAPAMACMSTEQLMHEIQCLPDSTGRRHPTDWGLGGSEMLAEEFAIFAEANPTRALEVIGQLKPGENEMVAGGGLRGLRKAKEHAKETLALIDELISKGFSTSRFKDDVGQCVYQIALDCQGLPEELCQVLESWLLAADLRSNSLEAEEEKQSDDKSEPRSILWRYGGFYTLPNENYWLGEAIKLGHCLASPPRDDHWYSFFERLVSIDFPVAVWDAWLWQLCRYVPSRDRIAPHVANLLIRRHDLSSNLAGYWAFASFFGSMELVTRTELLNKLFASAKIDDQQAAAEIATYVGYPSGDPMSIQLVDDALSSSSPNPDILNGIAFAAAELWTDRIESRELSLGLLKKLFAAGCDSTSSTLMSIFRHDNTLDRSENSRRLLELAMNNMQFDRVRDVWPLVRHLTKYMEIEPRQTLSVCQRIVDRVRNLAANETSAKLALSEQPLVSIALTLHRSTDPEIAAEALTLFEDLMDLQAYDAFDKLRELDGRFTKS